MTGCHPVIIIENPCYTTKRGGIVSLKNTQSIKQVSKDLKEIISRLNKRLDEPFVAAGIVTGDKGIKQA